MATIRMATIAAMGIEGHSTAIRRKGYRFCSLDLLLKDHARVQEGDMSALKTLPLRVKENNRRFQLDCMQRGAPDRSSFNG